MERHRLMVRYLQARTDLFEGRNKRILHVAPEARFEQLFRGLPGSRYVSIDLSTVRRPKVIADITRLPFAVGAFDVIYCSHVLEHIPDDRAAMRELRRVLAPHGWAILQSPIDYTDRPTFEDWSVTTPAERLRVFGQDDHVRIYGTDYVTRLADAGFTVSMDPYVREHTPGDLQRFGLLADEDVCVCRPS
jgi:SAM-dependent methyltransferase